MINYKEQLLVAVQAPVYKLKTLHYAELVFDRLANFFDKKEFIVGKPRDFLKDQHFFQRSFDTYVSPHQIDDYNSVYKNYIDNLRLIKSLCVEFKIKCKIIIQPTIGQKNLKHKYEKKYFSNVKFENFEINIKNWFKNVVMHAGQINQDEYFEIHDLSNIFKDDDTLVYYDLFHYNDYANRIIAKQIAKLYD